MTRAFFLGRTCGVVPVIQARAHVCVCVILTAAWMVSGTTDFWESEPGCALPPSLPPCPWFFIHDIFTHSPFMKYAFIEFRQ